MVPRNTGQMTKASNTYEHAPPPTAATAVPVYDLFQFSCPLSTTNIACFDFRPVSWGNLPLRPVKVVLDPV